MACGGSPTKICGGPDALTIFAVPSKITKLSADLTAKVASLPSGWAPASTICIAEGQNGRALDGPATASDDMTPSKCASFCGSQGFKYAGVEYSNECRCGNNFSNGASLSGASWQCNMGCSGDSNLICGGPGALSLYINPSIVPPVTLSNAPTVNGNLPAGWSAASTQCIKEVAGRALTGASIAGNSMTISTCLSFCQSRGFQLAGLEFGCMFLACPVSFADFLQPNAIAPTPSPTGPRFRSRPTNATCHALPMPPPHVVDPTQFSFTRILH